MAVKLAQLRQLLNYDPETGEFTWKISISNRAPAGSEAGTVGALGYRYIGIRGHRYLAHRLAWFYQTGRWPKKNIDHINGAPSDNRFSNLREASQQQNCWNRKARQSSTGLTGVQPKRDRWQARLRGKSLGCFDTPDDAHAAYRAASIAAFGEFARAS